MTKNPIANALAALLYIALVSLVMWYGGRLSGPAPSFIAPIALISLFTLSAAVMGYIFLFNPGQLYFDGKKKEGLRLFIQTVAVFGLITLILLGLLFSGLFAQKKSLPTYGARQSSSSGKPGKAPVGMANPASTFCVDQGGESVIVTAADGSQSGVCRFADGRKCDEWSFYRSKTCP